MNKKVFIFIFLMFLLPSCGREKSFINIDSNEIIPPEVTVIPQNNLPIEETNPIHACEEPEENQTFIDIDPYHLFMYMDFLIQYIYQPVSSAKDLEQINLLDFIFHWSCRYHKTADGFNLPGGTQIFPAVTDGFLSREKLETYLCALLGLGPEYLDKYTDASYKFPSEYNYYDPSESMFHFAAGLYDMSYHAFSRNDTVITIDGNSIGVKTMVILTDKQVSVDYTFIAHTLDGEIYYRLSSAAVYEDERNKNEIILTLEGIDFTAPWYAVFRGGEKSYHTPQPVWDNGYLTWDPPYEPVIKLETHRIKNGTAYVNVYYYAVVDTYIYEIENKTGRWLSGADNIEEFYQKEISDFWALAKEEEYGWSLPNYYHNNSMMLLSMAYDYALIRRSKYIWKGPGEYYFYNLLTGEEIFVCESYTRKYIISYMEESFYWADDDHLDIFVWLEDETLSYYDTGGYARYEVFYDGEKWNVSNLHAPPGEYYGNYGN